jgi:hypothetical protein
VYFPPAIARVENRHRVARPSIKPPPPAPDFNLGQGARRDPRPSFERFEGKPDRVVQIFGREVPGDDCVVLRVQQAALELRPITLAHLIAAVVVSGGLSVATVPRPRPAACLCLRPTPRHHADDPARAETARPVLSKLFRRLMLEKLTAAHAAGQLQFFGDHAHLAQRDVFAAVLAPLGKTKWFVYSKHPFAGPKAVLAYLSRYTHRVAISNRRLIAADQNSVTFKVKDYRITGPDRYTTMTLDVAEFIRRFLIHVLPKGFHRIRHYGLFANGSRAETLARARELLAVAAPSAETDRQAPGDPGQANALAQPCPCCGSRMIIIETFERGAYPHHRASASPVAIEIDTS